MLPKRSLPPHTRYRLLSPERSRPLLLKFYFVTELLEARAESRWPTNSDGADEEVNVYLADLLVRSLKCGENDVLLPGAAPLHTPPAKSDPPWRRAEFYRLNGDVRLIGLGLCGHGDLLSRRLVPWGFGTDEARSRDLHVGRTCYRLAGDALRRLDDHRRGLAPVLDRLAERFGEYVHVLEVLARGRLGLGARLSSAALRELLPPGTTS